MCRLPDSLLDINTCRSCIFPAGWKRLSRRSRHTCPETLADGAACIARILVETSTSLDPRSTIAADSLPRSCKCA
jgi:hypothetical protein